ncbi:hypothetical protein F164LOC_13810 [Pectobacterium carotovorum]|nr:hypothetical protein F164LOC_13810 [Pectobacterium carotovorum]
MLTDSKVRSAKPLAKSYKLTDSQGLYLTVSTSGTKLWYFRYRFGGKENRLAFGPYPQTTLAEAREKRDAARKLLASGISPSQLRKTNTPAVEESRTFQYVALAWHTSSLKLWSEAHADKILTCLKRYVFPAIGAMDIAQVETRHLAQLVKEIDDKGVHDVAGRVRQHLTKIMRHAVQQGVIKYNPAYDLDGVVTPVATQHHPALPLKRLPELLAKIDSYKGRTLTRLALELNLHVFLRSSELRFARWDEFNLKAHIWSVPAQREAVNGVRAAYVHKAEHLEARIEMMQWWSDYLDVNRDGYVAPYIYARSYKAG